MHGHGGEHRLTESFGNRFLAQYFEAYDPVFFAPSRQSHAPCHYGTESQHVSQTASDFECWPTLQKNLRFMFRELEPESQGSSVYGFASTSVHEQGFLPRDHTALPTSVPGLSAQPPSMWTVPSTCQVTYPPLNRILSLPTQSSWMGEIMQTTDST